MPALTVDVTTDDHPAQEVFYSDRNTETAYIGGVGSGKTAGGILRTGRHVTDWNEGHTGAIVAPTVPMLRSVIVPELREWGLLDKPGIDYRRSENTIEYPNGSTIILESANNDRKIDRLRGLNLAWAWMDEAAYLPEKVYSVLSDRLRVGNYRNLFVSTTPLGFNWVYERFGDLDDATSQSVSDGRVLSNDVTTSILGVSTEANPGNPDDYIEREKRQHSGATYEQEVLGEFTKFEGLVYDWFSSDEHVLDADAVPEPGSYDDVVYGVDWGHNNPATIVTLVRQSRPGTDADRWIAVDEWYSRRQTVNDHSRALEDMQDHWGAGTAYCDPSEPANIETMQRDGLDARKAKNDVTPGIQHVTSLRDRLRVAPSCQNLRNEFSQYRYKEDGESDDPMKQNDHLMDSCRYALFTHSNVGTVTRRTPGSAGKSSQ